MKKLIISILLCCFIFSQIPVIFAVQNDTSISNSKNLLLSLGVLQEKDSFLNNENGIITRGDFAKIIARLFIPNYICDLNQEAIFKDVAIDSSYGNEIYALYNLGVILRTSDNMFEPNSPILFVQAITVTLKALGYKEYINLKGGYPYGSIIVASDIGFECGNYNNNELTVNDLIKLLNELLDVKVMTVISNGEKTTYTTKDTDTVLKLYFDCYKIKGILEATQRINIKGGNLTNENEIILDGELYKCDKEYPIEYVGQKVECYLKKSDNIEKVIYLSPNNANQVINIMSEDISHYSDKEYQYTNANGSTSKISLSNNADIIYNDSLMLNYNENLFCPKDGYITLIDNDNDGIYDVLFIVSYVNYCVKNIYTDNGCTYIYDVGNNPALINKESEKNNTVICDENGSVRGASSIRKGDIISVIGIEQDDIFIVSRAFISNKSISGALTEREITEDGVILTVNDKSYSVAQNYLRVSKTLTLKEEITFYLDYMGKIAGTVNNSLLNLSMSVGYLIDAGINPHDKQVEFKILTDFGKVAIFKTSDKITFEDKRYNPEVIVNTYLGGFSDINSQLIGYKVNNDGKLYFLDLCRSFSDSLANDYSESIYKLFNKTEYIYLGAQRSFYGATSVTQDTLVFCIPDPTKKSIAEDEDYRVINSGEIINEKSYCVEPYIINSDSIEADILILYDNFEPVVNNKSSISVIKSITSCVREGDSIEYKKVIMLGADGTKTFFVKDKDILNNVVAYGDSSGDTVYEAKVGDVVRYACDGYGYLNYLEMVYDYDKSSFKPELPFSSTFYNISRPMMVNVYAKNNNTIQIASYSTDFKSNSFDHTQLMEYLISNFRIIIIGAQANNKLQIYFGNSDDILTYKNNGVYSKTIMDTRYGVGKVLIVFK